MIKTVIFDYGGVMTVAKRSQQLAEWAEDNFSVPKEKTIETFKTATSKAYDTGKISKQDYWRQFIDLGIPVTVEELSGRFVGYNTPDPKMLTLIRRLQAEGYDLCLISDCIGDLRKDVEKRFGNFFRTMCFSDTERAVKKDNSLFDIAFAKIDRRFDECLYIDDKPELLEYPASKGITCILYTGFDTFKVELTKVLPELRL